jgi:hypothetical protein
VLLKPYAPAVTPLSSFRVILIISVCTGHAAVQLFIVSVGHTVSITTVHASVLSAIVFSALSLAPVTLKCNVPFVLAETFMLHCHVVGVASTYQFVCHAVPLGVTT